MSRTSTPVRAIPSNLSSKSALSAPSPVQTYEPFVKATLRQRLTSKVFLLSAIFSWFQAFCWSIWARGGFRFLGFSGVLMSLIQPLTILGGLANWMVVAVPVVVLRKLYLHPARTRASSPAKTWHAAWVKPSTRRSLSVLCASALLSTAISVLSAHLVETDVQGDPRLSLFVQSKKHPQYLNGRLIFLIITQLIMAGSFIVRDVMLDRFVFRWSFSQVKFGLLDLFQAILFAAVLTSASMAVAAYVFALLRLSLPVLYRIPVLPMLLRPFTAHFLRGSWTFLLPFYHYRLLVRAWFLGFTTIANWEFSEALFDSFISQPIRVSHYTADATVTMVSGVTSLDRTFKFFALLELQEFAADSSSTGSTRRTEFFGNQKYSPPLWSQLCRELLILLGQDYQLFLRRGAPLSLAPPPAKEVVSRPVNGPPMTPTQLINKPIFQSGKKSPIKTVLDSLAADGSLSQAVEAGAEAAHLPEALKSVEDALFKPGLEKSKGEVTKGINGAKSLMERTKTAFYGATQGFTPQWMGTALSGARSWWSEDRLSKIAEGCVPFRELDAAAIDVLSRLVCASLKEDRYGVVQRDTPKILEAMLSFLSAIEEYQLEINARLEPPSTQEQATAEEVVQREALRMEIEKAGEHLGVICNELKEGVGRIVQTFGDKLQAFKFPPHTARKLQGFLDYC
ncbi:hypothetical protein E1B28_005777 [Marasmius oreades]|uniref:Nucleoporin NDC1 n=1 Tax=Marasmius oreades TaxID=181124 RepID=A0A9P7S470_9AGAR|nr:uncharacterized protein E1B28_005777 [Marasmius oreades]KAG7094980.1 hypothetical protein E1B28_005777 [Marasmius oreades]